MKVGLTLGKFLPFHQGHELLLQTAAACVDKLIVLIGFTDEDFIPVQKRIEWAAKAIGGWPHQIIAQREFDINVSKDEKGTITDESYWDRWLADTARILDDVSPSNYITHVFTSDEYGKRIAEELSAEWYPVDPDREIIQVSGTKVRSDLQQYFSLLPNYVKPSFVKKVAIVGPESTGKSLLVKELGKHFGCPCVPEYGRTICKPRHNKLNRQDFEVILHGQDAFIENAVSRCYDVPLVISDTESLVTALYFELWHPDADSLPFFEFARQRDIDLYLCMAPSVPWVQDGERVMTEMQRWQFYYGMVQKLREWKKPFHMIEHSDYTYRSAKVIEHIERLFK
jgi:NadR type nicotinamide-nucleotide adenylyltransferase